MAILRDDENKREMVVTPPVISGKAQSVHQNVDANKLLEDTKPPIQVFRLPNSPLGITKSKLREPAPEKLYASYLSEPTGEQPSAAIQSTQQPSGQTGQQSQVSVPGQQAQPIDDIQKEIQYLEQSKEILMQTNKELRDRIGGSTNPQVSITYERDTSRKPPATPEEKLSQLKSDIDLLRAEKDAYYSKLQRQAARQPFTIHTAPNGKIDIILEDGKSLRVEPYIQAKDGSWVINPYVVAALNYRQAKEVAQTQKEAHVEGRQLSVEAEKEKAYQRQKEHEDREYKKQFLGRLAWLGKEYDKLYADLSSPGGLTVNTEPLVKADQDIALTMYEAGVKDEGVKAIAEALKAGKKLTPKKENGKLVFSRHGTVQYTIEGEPGKVLFRPAYTPDMVLGGGS